MIVSMSDKEIPGGDMTWMRSSYVVATLLPCWAAVPVEAQLEPHAIRVSIDADVFSAGVVKQEPIGPATQTKTTVISIGPNQLGNSQAVIPTPSIGMGAAYVLKPMWMLGLRYGLGFDHVSLDGSPDAKVFAISFMPELTFVPTGQTVKPFLRFSPIAQYNHSKQGGTKEHIFMGCFSAGLGAMWFSSKASSIDVGAYFEGRFGNLKQEPSGDEVDVDDLRGVIRMGLSLWI